MTIFQVTKRTPTGEHAGYEYVTSRTKARKLQERINRKSGIEDDFEEYEFKAIKKEICALLNKVGAHPDYVSGVVDMIHKYWRFDENQQPVSNWHEKQELIEMLMNK